MSTTSKPYDLQYKILIVGDSAVGKTSILTRFADDAFYSNYLATIGTFITSNSIKIEYEQFKILHQGNIFTCFVPIY